MPDLGHFIPAARRLLAVFALAGAAAPALALNLGVQLNPDRVRPGEAIVGQITVTNDSGSTVSSVTLQAVVPAVGVNWISPSYFTGGATCSGNCDPGETINWNLGALPPGGGVTVSAPFTVASGAADGTAIELQATVLVAAVAQGSAAQSVTVDADNALNLALLMDANGAAPGSALTYTLVYGNRSGSTVTGTVLSLPLPAGVAFVSASGGGVASAGAVQWNLGTLQGGQSGRQQVMVTVGSGLGSGTLLSVDAAAISGTSAFTGAEVARATAITRVQSEPTLGLAFSTRTDPLRPGEAGLTHVTVSNQGDSTVFNATLKVRMPTEGLDWIPTVYVTGPVSCSGNCDPYELMTWNIGTLPPGGAVTYSMPARVDSGFASGRLVAYEAEVRADGVPMALAGQALPSDADAALTLALRTDKDGPLPGDAVTYTLTYANRSGASVSGATLDLPLPPGVAFVSASGGGTLADGIVHWSLGAIQGGQAAAQQVRVTVDQGLMPGSQLRVDSAAVSATSAFTGAETARASLATRVLGMRALEIAYATSFDPGRPDEAQYARLTVSNRSDSTLFGTTLKARMPTEGLDWTPTSYGSGPIACSGNCDPWKLTTWNIGSLPPGGSVTYDLPASMAGGFASGRLILHEAQVEADGVPQMLARAAVVADADASLALALDTDRDSATPGQPISYRLLFASRGPASTSGTTLSFPIPEGTTLLSAGGGTVAGGRVSWNLGTLLAGSGGMRIVTLMVPPATPGSARQIVVDAAELTGTSGSSVERARSADVTRVADAQPLHLQILTDPAPAAPGQALTVVVRLTNTGLIPAFGTTVRVRVPSEGVGWIPLSVLTPAGASCSGNCDPWEFATWSLGTVAPGTTIEMTMPLTVSSSFTPGRLIRHNVIATDDAGDLGVATATTLVGSLNQYDDSDGDGVRDVFDNCSLVANATQLDADHDGYGNSCDADFDNSGAVNFGDLTLFKGAFGSTNSEYDLDGSGSVNFGDLTLFKSLFGKLPGPSGLRP